MTSEYYTIAEVAQLLKVNEITIRRWARAGKLQLITLPGGKQRIAAAELERITTQPKSQ